MPPNSEWKKEFYESFDRTPLWVTIGTFLSFMGLILMGHVRDFLRWCGIEEINSFKEPIIPGFAPLYSDFQAFNNYNVYRRLRDCGTKCICSCPGVSVDVLDRETRDCGWTFKYTGSSYRLMNFSSFNYLGFGQNEGPCTDSSEEATKRFGCSTASTRQEIGNTEELVELDNLVAEFVGQEDAITFGMGFGTNSMNMPLLVSKGCLIISDERNHASLILGATLSGASKKIFAHNDMDDLEAKLRESIIYGQPRTHRPWKKILIVVEGIYSMEGSFVKLPEIVRLKKKYKAYVYIDEAHSIGAVGPGGRGVVEHFGVNPKDIDIQMGTFSKSFGASGGYIAGSREVINHLRSKSHNMCYGCSMTPPVTRQVLVSMKIIMGKDGTDDGQRRIKQLYENTLYFRKRLRDMGFIVYGNRYSPAITLLLFFPSKIGGFSRETYARGLGLGVIGYPITSLYASRARFCLSAGHTKEMMDKALEIISDVGDLITLKYRANESKEQMSLFDEERLKGKF